MDTISKIKSGLRPDTVIVSLAPKITIAKIAEAFAGFANIVRMNPSASTFVKKGVNPIAFPGTMSTALKSKLLEFLKPLGYLPVIEESKLEAYAVISAMGHTYFFFQLQKLKEMAVIFGMDDKEAQKVISKMMRGTTETLFESGLSYNEVNDLVPIKPLAEVEEIIKGYYDHYLLTLFNKIKP